MTGTEFKQFIADQEWSVEDAARFIGVSRSTIYDLYNREQVPGTISKICQLLPLVPTKDLKTIEF